MGGPCFLVNDLGGKTRAPPCTDNFQILPFDFAGNKWYSVEQCYQALKFTDLTFQHSLRAQCSTGSASSNGVGGLRIHVSDEMRARFNDIQRAAPQREESDSAFGMRAWNLGQKCRNLRPDWESVKVEAMFVVNCAKYCGSRELCEELVTTSGSGRIQGGASTWKWAEWNGRIQEQIRDILVAGSTGGGAPPGGGGGIDIEKGMAALKTIAAERDGGILFRS